MGKPDDGTADIEIANHGSVYTFTPITQEGAAWLAALDAEPWQWVGAALAVDHNLARPLARHATDDGLRVE